MKRGIDYIGVGVGAIIINEEARIFLARQSPAAKNEQGLWEFPGGSVEFGETLAEAVICFQMPSAKDWGLTASRMHIGGGEYPYSGGALLPGKDGREFSLTDPERCGSIGFDIPYDESATSVTLTVPKLVASLSELIDQEHLNIANQRLADQGIEFDYVPIDHGADIEILNQPEGATNMGSTCRSI